MESKKIIITLIIFMVINGLKIFSQSNYAYTEVKTNIFSEILKEDRPITIYLPEGYENEKIKYPVIYVLDAETRCTHAVPTVRFISSEGLMPKAIIVGIPNVNRERDFLPGRQQNSVAGDGADMFLQFIASELFTYMEKQYRTDSYRILIGHSYGGVFAMHALISRPDAFDAFIMIDPSFLYASKMMIPKTNEFLCKNTNLPKTIYISGTEGKRWHIMAISDMDSILKINAPKDLRWKTFAYANETHGSVTFKTIYDGLRFIFKDYQSSFYGSLVPDHGMIVKDKPYEVKLFSNSKNLTYTLDGSIPTEKSFKILMDTTNIFNIKIDKPLSLNIKEPSRFEGTKMITGEYKEAAPFNSVKKKGKVKNGIRYKAFDGQWDKLPDFSALKPSSTGILKNFTFPDSTKTDNFAVQYEGYLKVPDEGYYDLGLNSDDGSKLFIDNVLILDNDGLHGAGKWISYRIYLKKGYHAIKVDFFEKAGDQVLDINFTRYPYANKTVTKISDNVLFYKED